MEYNNNLPIYLQVINQIKKDMIQGRLPMGEKLPSTRELAVQYQINPNTAVRVYKEMEQSGMCFTKRGLGTFVTENVEVITKMKEEMAGELLENFVQEMQDLGFTKEELITIIEKRLDEQA